MKSFTKNMFIGVFLLTLVITLAWSYSQVHNIILRKAVAHARRNMYFAALKNYTQTHHEFPSRLVFDESHSEFLSYAGESYDAKETKLNSPEFIFPILDVDGHWLANVGEAWSGRVPVFVQLAHGARRSGVIIVRPDGPFLQGNGKVTKIDLCGERLILFSNEEIVIPSGLIPAEVSQFILELVDVDTPPDTATRVRMPARYVFAIMSRFAQIVSEGSCENVYRTTGFPWSPGITFGAMEACGNCCFRCVDGNLACQV